VQRKSTFTVGIDLAIVDGEIACLEQGAQRSQAV
jgi:hypothetical protein